MVAHVRGTFLSRTSAVPKTHEEFRPFGASPNPKPHAGARLCLFDIEVGLRRTAFITAAGNLTERDDRPIPVVELRPRRHARVEDRIRQATARGPRNLPCKTARVKEGG